MKITEQIALQVLAVVDQGLYAGPGHELPGQMGLEAAICFALGERKSDQPSCVTPALSRFCLDFSRGHWSSSAARAQGLRRLAIAQLGTANSLDEVLFEQHLTAATVRRLLPKAVRYLAYTCQEPHRANLLETARQCECEATKYASLKAFNAAADARAASFNRKPATCVVSAASTAHFLETPLNSLNEAFARYEGSRRAAETARWAALGAHSVCSAPATDTLLHWFAEKVVRILIEMKTPGSKFLHLTQ
ncbi:MAG: hypothetical protein IT342_21870 [Candidatus Melainabacteria bacterium]|nr:hypothetical protein [Candidatus Melainabacteria bacterium]